MNHIPGKVCLCFIVHTGIYIRNQIKDISTIKNPTEQSSIGFFIVLMILTTYFF